MLRFALLSVLFLATSITHEAGHAASFNELIDGDLSNSGLTPTPLAVSVGSNLIRGRMGGGDLDYLALSLPSGFRLDAIVVMNDTNITGGTRSFIGVQSGSTMTVLPESGSPDGLLGYTHFDFGSYGTNILGEIGTGFGSQGFAPPLPSGVYTFWVQDTGTPIGSYHFDFQVSAVPEPLMVFSLLAGLGLVAGVTYRGKRSL